MKFQEVKNNAKKMGIKAGSMKKSELIRAIQRAEGNVECFGIGMAEECRQMNCLWREDCLGSNN